MPLVDFRLQTAGCTWENTSIFRSGNYPEDDVRKITRYARDLANRFGREVRWNWFGSKQGHYVSPTRRKNVEHPDR